jgi:hypothetical protein
MQKHNGIHFSIWACHPSRRGHANLLCIVPILTDVPEGTNPKSAHRLNTLQISVFSFMGSSPLLKHHFHKHIQSIMLSLIIQKHNGIHFSIWACHPSRRGHANLLCIVPILTDVPEGTNPKSAHSTQSHNSLRFRPINIHSPFASSLFLPKHRRILSRHHQLSHL